MSIGYFSGKKIRNFSQYAVHDRNYHTFVMVATIFATMIGGNSIIGSVTESFTYGILYIIVTFGFSIKPLVISELIAPKIKQHFNQAISIGEIFLQLYGRVGQIISGISVGAISIASVAAQIFAIGSLMHYFLHIPYEYGVVIGYGIVIFYSTFGGINSVVKTDLFQFAILIIAIPIVYTETLEVVGGYRNFFDALPQEKMSFTADMEGFKEHFMLFMTFCFLYITPTILQRVLLSKNSKQAINSFRIAAFIGLFLSVIIVLIGMMGYVLNPRLEANSVLFYLVDNIMPVGLRGIIISGLVAVIMSTADSHLNVAGVAIVNDVIKPVFKNSLGVKKELIIARVMTFFLGSSTLFIALMYKNILKIVVFSAYFWVTILLVPFIFGIWGYILTLRNFLICVAFGSCSSIIWVLYLKSKFHIDGIIPITFLDIILFIVLYQFGGQRIFKGEKNSEDSGGGVTFREFFSKASGAVLSIFSFSKIIEFVHQKVRYYGRQYYLTFGFIGMAIYIIPYFMWSYNGGVRHVEITLRAIACALCFCLVIWTIAKGEEEAKTSKYLPFYWYFTLLFCLPFLSTFLTIDSKASDDFWILNTVVSTFILTLLVDWVSFIAIMVIGVSSAFVVQNFLQEDFTILTHNYDYVIYAAACTSVLSYFILYLRELDLKRLRRITNLLKNAVSELKSSKILLEEKNSEMLIKNAELEDTKMQLKEANQMLMKNVEEKTTHLENALTQNKKINLTLEKSHNDNIKSDRKLAKALEYKKEIFHNISHEVRTPIQGIISVSEILQGQWGSFSDEEKLTYVNMIADSGSRLMTFLSDLLEVAKFDSGKMLLEIEKNDLRKAAEDIIEESKVLCLQKQISLRLEIQDDIDLVAPFDVLRIKQVIRNLISNAIKFSEYGEILVRIDNKTFRIDKNSMNAKHLCFSVIDSGIGIDKNELTKIFEPFQQGSNTKTGAGGTGLGLAICQNIIFYHSGVIWAENNLEKGATFSFALPYSQNQKKIKAEPLKNFNVSKASKTTLIVEDEKILRNALNMVISSHGLRVIEAAGALEALSKLYEHYEEIDLILMDMMMPDMYGIDLIEVIKKEPKFKNIPIILQSGMVDIDEINKAFSLGVVGHITKPYNKDAIIKTIEEAYEFIES